MSSSSRPCKSLLCFLSRNIAENYNVGFNNIGIFRMFRTRKHNKAEKIAEITFCKVSSPYDISTLDD